MSKEQSALLWLSLSIGLALAVDICEYQMDGVHLSHPADCNKFVECQNGETHRILNCPLGLHFNRFKGVCDLRQRAACDIEYVNFLNEANNCSACCALYGCYVKPDCPGTPGTFTTVISPSTSVTTEACTTAETTEIPGTLSTPANSESTSTPKPSYPPPPETPTTMASTERPSTPDNPDISTTPASSSSARTSSSTSTPASPETPVTPVIPKNNQCANNLTVCQNEPDNSSMHVNGTCHQYIVCAGGCAYITTCPANLQYNVAEEKCDYPQNVDCPWQTKPSITGPSGVTCAHHGQCEKQLDGKLFADPNSDGYIICQCECEIARPCPERTKFDAKLLTCAWKANETENEIPPKTESSNGSVNTISTVCQNNVEICRNQTEGKLFAIDGICNKFYKCNFGCAIEILCPNNLVYNPQAEYCDYPYNYKCPWPFKPPSGPSAGPSGISCASGGRCVGKLDGTLLPSMTSCDRYVICQCECEVERSCAKGLYWDKKLLTCNYPANTTCTINS